jgi:multicomponent Na+:H+ antiporter subunit C
MIYSLCLVLIFVGLYGVVINRNIMKIVLSLLIMEHGVHLLLIMIGYRNGGNPPIMEQGMTTAMFAGNAVDPIPQALVLTSIVIGLGVLAMLVALCIRLYERYRTFDVDKMRSQRG